MPSPLTLPAPRTPGRYRIAMVCLGNICRSPMADVVLAEMLDDAGLAARVQVRSGGTGGWHAGDPMDRRAAATLIAADHDPSAHRAQQVRPAWLAEDDLVLAMDADNLADLTALPGGEQARAEGRLRAYRDADPLGPGDVPDPYYGGPEGFEQVLAMVERTSAALVAALERLDLDAV
ncbi:low molecular weight phosphotyrosine protein phosphatase [Nocardioides sp. TRM66260-LWL]|uniref:low molecular weight protein-tyrosine-phosphatase n=1 Tax=Nocardioides sp. TRM66260-LWL TaxID=2874478 RepID=UPI001CC64AF5|nr:low molecular weight protein-tyrosine-phosphatase [Nocardioides sp. TRM66260-LWL]MBZ5735986.1 low molecular weight phosphotyrosine protein phosphatase [Nocardioides sp. TRM66260-LWL]